jgi:GTP cyclohydrolase II
MNIMGLPKPTVQQLLSENRDHACPEAPEICVKVMAIANLPDMFGEFQVVAFWNNFDRKEHAALIHGDIFEKEEVPVRLHSECLTGDTLGSLRCDCREQLQESMRQISKMDRGIVLYMRQEGRGIGFINKIKAYQLQDEGYDTFKANEVLGFKRDERDYDIAAHMLRSLHVKSIKLMTNNPAKIKDLQLHGIRITGRIPIVVPPNKYDKFYLETKKRAGHLLDKTQPEEFLEQSDELTDNHHWEQAE